MGKSQSWQQLMLQFTLLANIVTTDPSKVYISKPSDYPHQPSKLLLFLTGGTGVHSTNNQLQADKFASHGFIVLMPDMFDGDAAPNSTTSVEEENATVIEQIKMEAVTAVKAFQIDMWLARHTGEKVIPILMRVIEAAKSEFADALAGGDGIYGVGYCFGAKYILHLGAEKAEPVSHVSYVTPATYPVELYSLYNERT